MTPPYNSDTIHDPFGEAADSLMSTAEDHGVQYKQRERTRHLLIAVLRDVARIRAAYNASLPPYHI